MSRVAYRVVQEALRNVVEHADATTARVAVAPEGDIVMVSVADDGRGMPPEVAGRGPRGAAAASATTSRTSAGRLEVGPRPSGGTLLTATIPLDLLGQG